jgi:hypothetical protein
MLEYNCAWGSIENPERISEAYNRCTFYGLVDECLEIKVKKKDIYLRD